MTPSELEALAYKANVFRSTVDRLPHPADDYEAWRQRWADVKRLADEVTAMAEPSA
jgi:hypothetical protein